MPVVHEEDRALSAAAMAQLLRPPHTCYFEQRAMTVQGWRWLAWSNRAVLNPQGEVEAIVGVGRDITERKHTELQLQESEARFRNVTTNLPGAVFRYGLRADGTDHITLMNQGCFDFGHLGTTTGAQAERHGRGRLKKGGGERSAMAGVGGEPPRGGGPCLGVGRVPPPGGGVEGVEGGGRPARQPNGDVVWDTLILDVSDRKNAELALSQTSRQLQSFSRQYPGHGGAVYCRGSLPEGE